MTLLPEFADDQVPLCVDLDGTLVNTDTLVELAVQAVKANPLCIFAMCVWLFRGKAYLKAKLAQHAALDVARLPYNQELIHWLVEQAATGRSLLLVTAANQRIADAVSEHLKLFSQALGSSATHNLSASRKHDELVRLFGKGGFDYAGNSRDDLEVWPSCRKAILVNTDRATTSHASSIANIEATFPGALRPWRGLLGAMRPHQWSKNLLVFVSILIAQSYTDVALLLSTCIGFVSFCLCSSAVYLINDMLDLQADRKHTEKRYRPFASGQAPIILGIVVTPLLLVLSLLLAVLVGSGFVSILVLYFTVTLGYSFLFKRLALLDVLILALLYTLRIVAGASVVESMPSVWLISFSMFFFTSLAMAKRYAELKFLEGDTGAWVAGRGYTVSDIAIIAQLGAASGYISTLVLALYIDSPDVAAIYHNQQVMWLLCPLLMYWIGRVWLVASRGELHHDPVVFATRDKASYLVFALGMLTLMAAL